MKLYRINEGFEGNWDEALHQKAFHEVRELTEGELAALELGFFDLDDDMEFVF